MSRPKRLFHVPSMSTVMYTSVKDDVEERGYVAVSHVWGDQQMYSADELGILNGINWQIPLHSHDKIIRLKSAMKFFRKEYCWFDVLCMPQDKQDEINLEIPLMGDYYSGACMTFVLSDNSYVISKEYNMWCSMMSTVMQSGTDFTRQQFMWINENKNLLDFSQDVWFARIWTLQEAALSKKLILMDINGSYLDLSDLLEKVRYLRENNVSYVFATFGNCTHVVNTANVLQRYKEGKLDLIHVLSVSSRRECYKIHDKFYGVLGVLGYKNFVVDYEVDMDDLNKQIIQHAYSKGDTSWLSVGGDIGAPFIQQIYEPFLVVGSRWSRISNVILDDMLHVQARVLGTITCLEKYTGRSDDLNEILSWTTRIFMSWGFNFTQILETMIEYDDIPIVSFYFGTRFIKMFSEGAKLENMSHKIALLTPMWLICAITNYPSAILKKFLELNSIYTMVTIVKIVVGDRSYPLIICGNADKGDIIVVTEARDEVNFRRCLGIVVSKSSERKGVCIVPKEIVKNNSVDTYVFVV